MALLHYMQLSKHVIVMKEMINCTGPTCLRLNDNLPVLGVYTMALSVFLR